MASVVASTEIKRSPSDVFAYVTDPSRFGEWQQNVVEGHIRARVDVRVEPLGGGARSHVTIGVDFEGRGIGKLLVPLVVRRQAAKEMPGNVQRLKERLEQPG